MSDPTTSLYPTPVATSDPAVSSGKTNVVRFSERVRDWFNGLAPSGATVYDTGWVTVTLSGSFTSNATPQVRRIGKQIFWRGDAQGNFTTALAAVAAPAALPSWAIPARSYRDVSSPLMLTGSAVVGYAVIDATNGLRISTSATATGAAVNLKGLSGYLAD